MFKRSLLSFVILSSFVTSTVYAESFNILKQISNKPVQLKDGDYV